MVFNSQTGNPAGARSRVGTGVEGTPQLGPIVLAWCLQAIQSKKQDILGLWATLADP